MTTYYIARSIGSHSGKVAWTPCTGKQYKTLRNAQNAYTKLETMWEYSIIGGYRHPSWAGKFSRNYKIIEVPTDKTFREVVNAMPGRIAWTLGA